MKSLLCVPCMASMLICCGTAIADECQPHWDNAIGQPGMDVQINAFAIFDDGSGGGLALYAGGQFTSAGGAPASRIAKWDGSAWPPLGDGVSGWVEALTVFDDGTGPALYAGGNFTAAGGVPANNIAKWDGSTWSALGDGTGPNQRVNALAVFDDGSGPALYVGGRFSSIDGVIMRRIAKWDGAAWSGVGDDGVNNDVESLAVYDDGTGPALYVGGPFTVAHEHNNAAASGGCFGHCGGEAPEGCWCDEFCCSIGDCCANKCEACSGCDVGSVPCPDGKFVYSIAKWDGTSWSDLDGGLRGFSAGFANVHAMTVHDGRLIIGGRFEIAGTSAAVTANNVAMWDGTIWWPLGEGTIGFVNALASLEHGEGEPILFAGGTFHTAGGEPASRIARWDGQSWSPLGSGTSHTVHALGAFDTGDGPHLYVGGQFTAAGGETANRIARWHDCPTPQHCVLTDLNCDGTVDVLDLLILLGAWGPCGRSCPADIDGSGTVDVIDLLILLSSWG